MGRVSVSETPLFGLTVPSLSLRSDLPSYPNRRVEESRARGVGGSRGRGVGGSRGRGVEGSGGAEGSTGVHPSLTPSPLSHLSLT